MTLTNMGFFNFQKLCPHKTGPKKKVLAEVRGVTQA